MKVGVLLAALQIGFQVIDRFRLAAEFLDQVAIGLGLDDHPRAFVHDPDILVLVDADGMREGGAILSGSHCLTNL